MATEEKPSTGRSLDLTYQVVILNREKKCFVTCLNGEENGCGVNLPWPTQLSQFVVFFALKFLTHKLNPSTIRLVNLAEDNR